MAYYDIREITFTETVAGRLTTGKMFNEFLEDKANAGIKFELSDEWQQPFGWQFFLHRPFGSTPLNPDATLIGNNLKPGDTITCGAYKKIVTHCYHDIIKKLNFYGNIQSPGQDKKDNYFFVDTACNRCY